VTNAPLIRVAKRLTTLLYFPFFLLVFAFMIPTSVFTWIITGKDIDEQMDFLEDKNADYWAWVKAE
jgi:hypothetical protein